MNIHMLRSVMHLKNIFWEYLGMRIRLTWPIPTYIPILHIYIKGFLHCIWLKSMQVEWAPGDALTFCVTSPRCIFFKHFLCKKSLPVSLAGYFQVFWSGRRWRDVVAIFRTDNHHLSLRIFSAMIVNKRDVHHSTGCIISVGSVGLTTHEPSE